MNELSKEQTEALTNVSIELAKAWSDLPIEICNAWEHFENVTPNGKFREKLRAIE